MSAALLLALATPALETTERVLPARFEAARVFVLPQTTDGETLRLFTDTGGGLFLTENTLDRLRLESVAPQESAAPAQRSVALPEFKPTAWIPAPLPNDGKLGVMPAAAATQNGFDADGMLGEAWFGGRVWTWDYPQHRLVLDGEGWQPGESDTRVALGFKSEDGKRANNFPRIAIRVEGEALEMLLDTGASTRLTDAALAALADKQPAMRATSFIAAVHFDAWHAAHPDWRVIEHAEQRSDAAMIEVPAVEIAGSTIGPVWFTRRPDKAFHEMMSSMMDKQVEGAIGGDALRHFRMTIDYPGTVAYFRCTQECEVTPRSAP